MVRTVAPLAISALRVWSKAFEGALTVETFETLAELITNWGILLWLLICSALIRSRWTWISTQFFPQRSFSRPEEAASAARETVQVLAGTLSASVPPAFRS